MPNRKQEIQEHFTALQDNMRVDEQGFDSDLDKIGAVYNVFRSIDEADEQYSNRISTARLTEKANKIKGSKIIYTPLTFKKVKKTYRMFWDDVEQVGDNEKILQGYRSDKLIKFYEGKKPVLKSFKKRKVDPVQLTIELRTSKNSGKICGTVYEGRRNEYLVNDMEVGVSEDTEGNFYSYSILPAYLQEMGIY